MKRLAAALEQALVGRVLDQRVLETVGGGRRGAVGEQEVGFGEPIERGLQRGSSNPAADDDTSLQQPVGKIAPQHRADLRDFARFAEPVEPRGERLLQGRRDRLRAALRVALEQEPRHLLDEQRHAAGSLAHSIDHLVGERMPARDLADHAAHLRAVERRERNDAVVRAHGPGRAEFRPRGGDDQQRGLRAALGERAP